MSDINKSNALPINRGVELVLKRRNSPKKIFSICYEKMIFLFRREIVIKFNFSLNIRKQK